MKFFLLIIASLFLVHAQVSEYLNRGFFQEEPNFQLGYTDSGTNGHPLLSNISFSHSDYFLMDNKHKTWITSEISVKGSSSNHILFNSSLYYSTHIPKNTPVYRSTILNLGAKNYYEKKIVQRSIGIGGRSIKGIISPDIFIYGTSDSLAGENISSLPIPLAGHIAGLYRPEGVIKEATNTYSKIFVFGGETSNKVFSSALYVSDIKSILNRYSLAWEKLTPQKGNVPAGRADFGGVLFHDRYFVFGGHNNTHVFGDLWYYSIAENIWYYDLSSSNEIYADDGSYSSASSESYAPSPRYGFSTFLSKDDSGYNYMIIHGGMDEDGRYLGDVWGYNLDRRFWLKLNMGINNIMTSSIIYDDTFYTRVARAFAATIFVDETRTIICGGRGEEGLLNDCFTIKFSKESPKLEKLSNLIIGIALIILLVTFLVVISVRYALENDY